MPYTIIRNIKNQYLYDRNQNELIPLAESEATAFLRIAQGKPKKEDNAILARFQAAGFCLDNTIKKIEHPMTPLIKEYVNSKMQQLILQVTQNCNLRCEYCSYSGSYYNRKHSNARMDAETAKKAVDFYIKHSHASNSLFIGFYGGEPLLEIELIKHVVEYVKNNYSEKEIKFNLTTNGTLLYGDTLDFLVQNNFTCMVSLDGPREVHDKQRRFVDGRGSFDVIRENLSKMKQKYLEYYKTCMTNTVLSPDADFKCVSDYLSVELAEGLIQTQISFISDTGAQEPVRYPEQVDIMRKQDETLTMLEMLWKITKRDKSVHVVDLNSDLRLKCKTLDNAKITAKSAHPSGPCVAGVRRCFVDVYGNLYPCEKVSETPEMRIGHIESGFDIDKVSEQINVAKLTEQGCKDCWAFIYCTGCIAQTIDKMGVSPERRLSKCNNIRTSVYNFLADVAFLRENGFDTQLFNTELSRDINE